LIVDVFGLKSLTVTQCEDWFDILAERYERGSLIVTSNRALSEWPDLFGNPILASAGLDRLFHNAHAIIITGESFRARARHLIAPADPSH
jgi:DNA replication protein DnaC